MEDFIDFKTYAKERTSIRINFTSNINSKLTKIKRSRLNGWIKQINNNPNLDKLNQLEIFKKELEFRDLCFSIKSIFNIELK